MMSETQVIDDDEKFVGTPAEDAKDVMRQAREMIPVGLSGAAPTTFADQVTFARDMAKARYSIPAHLQNNVGDCLAIVDMASRAGLSPYMVAQKTYVQSGRINFESQLYHAFLQASGLLKGDLFVEYENTGDDLVCVITGYLKGDSAPRIHRSEPFAKMHPGHSTKTVDGVEKKFVRGSPLWDRKPKLQLFYDTSRDWVRMYAPRATLGILTPYEQEEYGPDNARDVTPVGLSARLKGLGTATTTGHRDGFADAELDTIENGGDPVQTAPAPDAGAPTNAETAPATTDRPKTAKRTTDRPRGKTARQEPDTKTAKPGSGKPAKPGKTEPATGAASGSGAANATAVAYPSNVPEYLRYARAWIKAATDMTSMGMQWRDEKNLRNKIGMTAEDRKPLEDLLAKRYGEK